MRPKEVRCRYIFNCAELISTLTLFIYLCYQCVIFFKIVSNIKKLFSGALSTKLYCFFFLLDNFRLEHIMQSSFSSELCCRFFL